MIEMPRSVEASEEWGEHQRRAVAAARELAEEGGYEAVQIRDVVARTGLSSATIYRHFSSKDHLIAAAQLEWNRTLPAARRKLPAGGTAADRVSSP
jgi:AcrR family transcriptional regulator